MPAFAANQPLSPNVLQPAHILAAYPPPGYNFAAHLPLSRNVPQPALRPLEFLLSREKSTAEIHFDGKKSFPNQPGL